MFVKHPRVNFTSNLCTNTSRSASY